MFIYGVLPAGPLFPGPQCRTSLAKAMAKLLEIARNSNWSQRSLTHAVSWFATEGLPDGNRLPVSMTAMLKLIRPFLPKSHRFGMCSKGCMLFRDQDIDLEECKECGMHAKNSQGTYHRFFYQTSLRESLAAFLKDPLLSAKLEAGKVQQGHSLQDFWGELLVKWFPCSPSDKHDPLDYVIAARVFSKLHPQTRATSNCTIQDSQVPTCCHGKIACKVIINKDTKTSRWRGCIWHIYDISTWRRAPCHLLNLYYLCTWSKLPELSCMSHWGHSWSLLSWWFCSWHVKV